MPTALVYRYFAGRCLEFHPLAELRRAERACRRQRRRRRTAPRRRADRARRLPTGRRDRRGSTSSTTPGGRAPWLSGMAQAVAAQAFARTAALVPDEATALMREAHAAYRVIPAPAADERRRRPLDSPLLVPVAARAQRAAAGRRLAAVVCDGCGRSRRGRARRTNAARGRGDAAELRHGLLDVLLAAARAVAARLPAVRRAAAEEARAERPAVRRRRHEDRRVSSTSRPRSGSPTPRSARCASGSRSRRPSR